MQQTIDRLIDDFEDGQLDRRQLLARMTAVATAAAAAMTGRSGRAQSADTPTFQAREVDHLALRVTDIERSRRFYERHLGLRTTRCGDSTCFLSAGDDFIALFRSQTPGLHHFSFGIDGYTPDAAVASLEAAGLESKRRENRVYFDDPDGLEVQVSST